MSRSCGLLLTGLFVFLHGLLCLSAEAIDHQLFTTFRGGCLERLHGDLSASCDSKLGPYQLAATVDFCTAQPPAGDGATQPITLAGFASPALSKAAQLVSPLPWTPGAEPSPVLVLPLTHLASPPPPPPPPPSGSVGPNASRATSVAAAAAAPWDLAPGADAWVAEAGRVGEAQLRGFAADLSYVAAAEAGLEWHGIGAVWRSLTAVYNRSIFAVPLSGGTLHLVYRRDLLLAAAAAAAADTAAADSSGGVGGGTASSSAAPPDTWPELLLMARALHGRSMGVAGAEAGGQAAGAAGSAGYGICLDVRPGCVALTYLNAIWASLAVSQGAAQGLWFDPGTMQPLLGTSALVEALRTWALLAALSPPADEAAVGSDAGSGGGGGCAATSAASGAAESVHPAFLAGRCAFTLATTAAVKSLLLSDSARNSSNSSNGSSGSNGSGSNGTTSAAAAAVVPARLVGVAPLPGSARVLDRTVGRLVPCTAELCPYGTTAASPTTAALSLDAAAAAAALPSSAQAPPPPPPPPTTTPAASSTALVTVNRAPMAGLGQLLVGVVSARVAPWRQALALRLLGQLAGPRGSLELALDPAVPVAPCRTEQIGSPWTAESDGRRRWAAAGYDTDGLAAVLAAAQAAAVHANGVPPLAVPGAEQISWILRAAADNMTAVMAAALPLARRSRLVLSGAPASTIDGPAAAPILTPALLASLTAAATASATAAQARVSELMWRGNGPGLQLAAAPPPPYSMYGVPSPPPPPAAAGAGSGNGTVSWTNVTLALLHQPYLMSIHSALTSVSLEDPASAAAKQSHGPRNGEVYMQVGVPLTCIFAAALTVLLVLNTRKARGRAYYAADAPPVSPDTCLIVTDVQDSTVLWEQLPAQVMDRAMQVHHRTMRFHLLPHSGYEAATEGDSFILAFLSATEALRYALAAQQALLEARWPPELLEAPACAPVWMAPAASPHTSKPDAVVSPFTRRTLVPGRASANRAALALAASAATLAASNSQIATVTADADVDGGHASGLHAPPSRQRSAPPGTPLNEAVAASATGSTPARWKHLVVWWKGSGAVLSSGSVGGGAGGDGGSAAGFGSSGVRPGRRSYSGTPRSEPQLRLGSPSPQRRRRRGRAGSSSAAGLLRTDSGCYRSGGEEGRAPLAHATSAGGGSEGARSGDESSDGGTETVGAGAGAAGGQPVPGRGDPPSTRSRSDADARSNRGPQRSARPHGSAARLIMRTAAAAAVTSKRTVSSDGGDDGGAGVGCGVDARRARGAGSFLDWLPRAGLPRSVSHGEQGLALPSAATGGAAVRGLREPRGGAPRKRSRLQHRAGAVLLTADGDAVAGGGGGAKGLTDGGGADSRAGWSRTGGGRDATPPLGSTSMPQWDAGVATRADPPSPFLAGPPPDDTGKHPGGEDEPGRRTGHGEASAAAPERGGGRWGLHRRSAPIAVPTTQRRPWWTSRRGDGGSEENGEPASAGAAASAATAASLGTSLGTSSRAASGSSSAAVARPPPLRSRLSVEVRRGAAWRGGLGSSLGGSGSPSVSGGGATPVRKEASDGGAAVAAAAATEGGAASGGGGGAAVGSSIGSTVHIRSLTDDGRKGSSSALITALLSGSLPTARSHPPRQPSRTLQAPPPLNSSASLPLPLSFALGMGTSPPPPLSPAAAPAEEAAAPLHRTLLARWQAAAEGTPGAVLLFRGLRVRVGLHAGVSSRGEMVYNRAAARMMYCGPVLRAAKAVGDAAHGGQVVLSCSAFAGLSQWMLNGEDSVTVWFGGRHLLQDDMPLQDLYVAYGRQLLARAALLPPGLRSRGCVQSGLAEALVGPVVLAALALQGGPGSGPAGGLGAGVGERCCAMLECVAVQLLRLLGGSLYESEQGCVVAAFPSARSAVQWLLHCQALLMAVPWEPALLASPLVERKTYAVRPERRPHASMAAAGAAAAGSAAAGDSWSTAVRGPPQLVTLAAPRVKGVADLAHVGPDVQRSSGRLVIPVRQRQRLQKLLAAARPGQVVCTSLVETAFAAETAQAAATEAAATASAATSAGAAAVAGPSAASADTGRVVADAGATVAGPVASAASATTLGAILRSHLSSRPDANADGDGDGAGESGGGGDGCSDTDGAARPGAGAAAAGDSGKPANADNKASPGALDRRMLASASSLSASILMLPGMEAVRFARQGRLQLERLGLLAPPPPPPPPPAARFASLASAPGGGAAGNSAGGGGAGGGGRLQILGVAAAAAAAAAAGLLQTTSRRHNLRRPLSLRHRGGGTGGGEPNDGSHHSQRSLPSVRTVAEEEAACPESWPRQARSRGGGGSGGSAVSLLQQVVHRSASNRLLTHASAHAVGASQAQPEGHDGAGACGTGAGGGGGGGGGRSWLGGGRLMLRRSETAAYRRQPRVDVDLELGAEGGGGGRVQSATALPTDGVGGVQAATGSSVGADSRSGGGASSAGARALAAIMQGLPGRRRRSAATAHSDLPPVAASAGGDGGRRANPGGVSVSEYGITTGLGLGLDGGGGSNIMASRVGSESRSRKPRTDNGVAFAAVPPRASSATFHFPRGHARSHHQSHAHSGERPLPGSRLGQAHGNRHGLSQGQGVLRLASQAPEESSCSGHASRQASGFGFTVGDGAVAVAGSEPHPRMQAKAPAPTTDPGMTANAAAAAAAPGLWPSYASAAVNGRLLSSMGDVGTGTGASPRLRALHAPPSGPSVADATATDEALMTSGAAASIFSTAAAPGMSGGGGGSDVSRAASLGRRFTMSPSASARGGRTAGGGSGAGGSGAGGASGSGGSRFPHKQRSGFRNPLSSGWQWLLHAFGASSRFVSAAEADGRADPRVGDGAGGSEGAVPPPRPAAAASAASSATAPAAAPQAEDPAAAADDITLRCLPLVAASREIEPAAGSLTSNEDAASELAAGVELTDPHPEGPVAPGPGTAFSTSKQLRCGEPESAGITLGSMDPRSVASATVSTLAEALALASASAATAPGPDPASRRVSHTGITATATGDINPKPQPHAVVEAPPGIASAPGGELTPAAADTTAEALPSGAISPAVAGGAAGSADCSDAATPRVASREPTLTRLRAAALRLTGTGHPDPGSEPSAPSGPPPQQLQLQPQQLQGPEATATSSAAAANRPLVFARVPPPLSDCPGAADALRELQAAAVRLTPLEATDPRVAASLGCGLYLCMLEATNMFGLSSSATDFSVQEASDADGEHAGWGLGHGRHGKGLFGFLWGRAARRAAATAAAAAAARSAAV